MNTINKATAAQINQLSPEQLSKVLHLLLIAEAHKNRLENVKILVPEKINVADGGEDGRIEWSGKTSSTHWLKNQLSIFQNKATDLRPAQCYEEILKKELKGKNRELKEQVKEIVVENGCYTLFTNQELNELQKKKRLARFRDAIKTAKHTNYDDVNIRIYDANDIKDWVNENIAVVTFVFSCVGITRPINFRTWEEWKNDLPGSEIPYQTNPTLDDSLIQVRETLATGKVLRIIGHSGLGKTRMVLEAFRENPLLPDIKAQQAQLVYYDMGLGSLEEISKYLLSHRPNQSGIIVIDNCDENSHNAIAGLIRASGNLKIITIDFASETQERSVIKLSRENQRDIVKKMVDEEFHSTISRTDKDFIANQSEGYPQMAILFSQSVKAGGLAGLNNKLPDEFLKKLVFGRNIESDFEFEIIKACSVISSFGFIDDSISSILRPEEKKVLNAQSDYVRTRICGKIQGNEVTEKEFYKVCQKYKQTNIIEQRGTKIMVKPTPLAISLAAMWWRETPHDIIREILEELKGSELGPRLVERLAELDQLDKAKEIVNELWGPKSPFGTAEVLNTNLGSLLFRYVVEVNPVATTQTLIAVFGKMSKEEILNIDQGRRNLVWALEKLCFRKETFNSASKVLYSFAVSENESWGNNATNQFRQLFQLSLSGTEASLLERLDVIRWGLEKNDDKYTEIAILAMGRGLLNDHFTRMGGPEHQGSSSPLEDYRPRWSEVIKYWSGLIQMLTEIATSDHPLSEVAKEKISNAIRTLVRDGQISLIEDCIAHIISIKGNLWPEALKNLRKTLSFEKNLSEDTIERVNHLIEQLTPTDLKNQLFLKVTNPEWDTFEKDDSGKYIDKPRLNAEAFAEELNTSESDWSPFLKDLLHGDQRQAFNFGSKYGTLVTNIEVLIENSMQALKLIEKENQNPELIAGLLDGASDKSLFGRVIDKFIADPSLQQHAFYLTRILHPSFEDIMKLFVLVDDYQFSITQFKNFEYGRALDNLTPEEVVKLCDNISHYGSAGKWTALSLVYMFCFSNDQNWKDCKGFIRELITSSNMTIDVDQTVRLESFHWSDAVTKILCEESDSNFAMKISNQIIEFCSQTDFNYSFDTYIKNVIRILFDNYFDTVWEIFGGGITGDYMTFFHLEHMIGAENGNISESMGIAFSRPARYKRILEWCRRYPEIAPQRIAHMMPLASIDADDMILWHPFSKALIDEFGQNKEVLERLWINMGSFGSVGSRIPYYTRQKKLLEGLENHKFPEVRSWAKTMLEHTEKIIKREGLNDEEYRIT